MSHIGLPRWSGEVKSDLYAVGLNKVPGLSFVHEFGLNEALPPKTDIWGTAIMAAGSGGVDIDYDVLLANVD